MGSGIGNQTRYQTEGNSRMKMLGLRGPPKGRSKKESPDPRSVSAARGVRRRYGLGKSKSDDS